MLAGGKPDKTRSLKEQLDHDLGWSPIKAHGHAHQEWRGEDMPMPHLDMGDGLTTFNTRHKYLVTLHRGGGTTRNETYKSLIGQKTATEDEQLGAGVVASDIDVEFEKAQRRNARMSLGPFANEEAKEKRYIKIEDRYKAHIKQLGTRHKDPRRKHGVDPRATFLRDYDYEMSDFKIRKAQHKMNWKASAGEESVLGHTDLTEEQLEARKEQAVEELIQKGVDPKMARKMSMQGHLDKVKHMSAAGQAKYFRRQAKSKGAEMLLEKERVVLEKKYVEERYKWQALRHAAEGRKKQIVALKRAQVEAQRQAKANGPTRKGLLDGLM